MFGKLHMKNKFNRIFLVIVALIASMAIVFTNSVNFASAGFDISTQTEQATLTTDNIPSGDQPEHEQPEGVNQPTEDETPQAPDENDPILPDNDETPDEEEIQEDSEDILINSPEKLPNIYFILFDEYSPPRVTGKYYGFYNTFFMNYLSDKNFAVSDTSVCNYPETHFSLAELHNLKAYTKRPTRSDSKKVPKNSSPLYETFRSLGYSVYKSRSSYAAFKVPSIETKKGALVPLSQLPTPVQPPESPKNVREHVFPNDAPKKDPVPYNKLVPLRRTTSGRPARMLKVFDTLDRFKKEGFVEPTVLFNYMCAPHVNFAYTANGTLQKSLNRSWKTPSIYLGYLKYITTRAMNVVDNILATDPDSIIIIQSDHGVRYRQLVFVPRKNKSVRDQYYVLNAVYYRGQQLSIEGLSPVNTMRTILAKLGHPDMPLTADPRALLLPTNRFETMAN